AVMASPAYRERLAGPTDWTCRVMPSFRAMNRSVCRVTASAGRGDGGIVAVVRLTPAPGGEAALRARLADATLPAIAAAPGVVAAHLWEVDAAASRSDT